MLGMKFNHKYYSPNQLCTFLKFALKCINFKTDGLTRDINCSFEGPEPKQIEEFFINVCDITLGAMNLEKSTSLAESGLTPSDINNALKYNSDDWSRQLKYCFQNTELINHSKEKAKENWLIFVKDMKEMIEKSVSYSDVDNPAFADISGVFKRFIGQLIIDEEIYTAEAIHLMIKFAYHASHRKANKMNCESVAKMLPLVFYGGLEFNTLLSNTNLKKDLDQLSLGLKLLFSNKFFKFDFNKDVYNHYRQDYGTPLLSKQTNTVAPSLTTMNSGNIDNSKSNKILTAFALNKVKEKEKTKSIKEEENKKEAHSSNSPRLRKSSSSES